MMTPPPGAAVFDLDGVIVDSRRPVRSSVNAALVECGFAERPDAELDRLIGPPVRGALAELTGTSADSPLLAACVDAYHRHYDAVYLEQTSAVAGIAEMLGALTLPLAIATAKVVDFVGPLLERLGLASRFQAVCAPTMRWPEEPKAALLARTLAQLGAQDVVMIGDRSFDVEAAHANGVRAIGVTWGIGDRAELEDAGAELVVERPDELLAQLEGSVRRR